MIGEKTNVTVIVLSSFTRQKFEITWIVTLRNMCSYFAIDEAKRKTSLQKCSN